MKKIFILAMILLLSSGCVEKTQDKEDLVDIPTESVNTIDVINGYVKGKWEGNNFASKTLGLQFSCPEEWIIEENNSEKSTQDSEIEVIREFLIHDKNYAFQFDGTSTLLNPLMKKISNGMITKMISNQLNREENYIYEIVEEGTFDLAGKEVAYLYVKETTNNTYHKFYVTVVEGYLFTLTCISDEDNKGRIDEFIQCIQIYE